ncbi:MAG: DUF3108 domain-containing protein [Pseudomonadota bacterium]
MRALSLSLLCGALLALPAHAAEHAAAPRRAVSLPPSVDLDYAIKARQRGFSLSGNATVSWRLAQSKYSLTALTNAVLLGKILENRSEGQVDAWGIAPVQFYEKRFRKDPATTTFDREARTITFTDGKLSYAIRGGEQDRATASWQLQALARGAPDKFTAGSEWTMFVAGRRDAEPWTFRVAGSETVRTGLGEVEAVHLTKAPPPDSRDQTVDIWLAPSLEWYPVRLKFSDADGDFVEQTLEKLTRK